MVKKTCCHVNKNDSLIKYKFQNQLNLCSFDDFYAIKQIFNRAERHTCIDRFGWCCKIVFEEDSKKGCSYTYMYL